MKMIRPRLTLTLLLALTLGCAASSSPLSSDGVTSSRVSTALEVFYIANEGYLIAASGKKVLIDALFREGVAGYAVISPSNRERLEQARSPFDQADLALATHYHADHFDPLAVANHLTHNPQALFISTPQAVDKLKSAYDKFDALKGRVIAANPKEGERIKLAHRGINVQVLNIHHGRNRPVENLGFIVDVAGRKLLHIGDSEATAADLQIYDLRKDGIDVAFLPYWYFMFDGWKKAVREQIQPKHIVVMHVPPLSQEDEWIKKRGGWAKVLGGIKAEFPNAVIFEKEMEKKDFDF